jgi:hypothetical protein
MYSTVRKRPHWEIIALVIEAVVSKSRGSRSCDS